MAFYRLEKLINLSEGYRKEFRVERHDILLLHQSGHSYLIENFCPHRGISLSKGIVSSGAITCPGHGFQFELSSGRCIKGQCSGLTMYPAEYDQEYLGIDI